MRSRPFCAFLAFLCVFSFSGCDKITEVINALPTPKPVESPSPSPTVAPTPEATPTPAPTPTPFVSACPKALAPGAKVRVDQKFYGERGRDTETRVEGDPEFCFLISGVRSSSCHLEGWGKRVECEMELLGGCPTHQYRVPNGEWKTCYSNPHPEINCDHLGSTEARDDPQTKDVFEGRPAECALQKSADGKLKGGFFMIPHGLGETRSCDAKGENCGICRLVDGSQLPGCPVNY